jgi:hypothetical protein
MRLGTPKLQFIVEILILISGNVIIAIGKEIFISLRYILASIIRIIRITINR